MQLYFNCLFWFLFKTNLSAYFLHIRTRKETEITTAQGERNPRYWNDLGGIGDKVRETYKSIERNSFLSSVLLSATTFPCGPALLLDLILDFVLDIVFQMRLEWYIKFQVWIPTNFKSTLSYLDNEQDSNSMGTPPCVWNSCVFHFFHFYWNFCFYGNIFIVLV